jgi:hypothetical protein
MGRGRCGSADRHGALLAISLETGFLGYYKTIREIREPPQRAENRLRNRLNRAVKNSDFVARTPFEKERQGGFSDADTFRMNESKK